jgi:hypothetical protein
LSSESSITVALSTTQTIALGLNHQAEGSFGPPADEKHTSSNELSAYAKLKYKDNATEFDIAAKLGSDKIYSVLASLRINF